MTAEPSAPPRPEQTDADFWLRTYRRFAGPLWFFAWSLLAGIILWLILDVEWHTVREFLFNDRILKGLRVTLFLTLWSMLLGVILGLLFGVMRVAHSSIVNGLANLYIWVIRGTPVLLQLFIVYFGLRDYIQPSWLGDTPFGNIPLLRDFNDVGFRAAVIALGVNEGAYMAEIVRAGIISVDTGQMEAARSLGMTNLQGMRRIVLPQAVRVIVPPTGNELIALTKNTSLVFTIGVFELFAFARQIYGRNFDIFELLLVAAFWYLVVTTVLSIGQAMLEARLASTREEAETRPLWRRALDVLNRPRLDGVGRD
ncbi:MAG: amino acid ABC transporter permease [Dehalococcoidia bacterium]